MLGSFSQGLGYHHAAGNRIHSPLGFGMGGMRSPGGGNGLSATPFSSPAPQATGQSAPAPQSQSSQPFIEGSNYGGLGGMQRTITGIHSTNPYAQFAQQNQGNVSGYQSTLGDVNPASFSNIPGYATTPDYSHQQVGESGGNGMPNFGYAPQQPSGNVYMQGLGNVPIGVAQQYGYGLQDPGAAQPNPTGGPTGSQIAQAYLQNYGGLGGMV